MADKFVYQEEGEFKVLSSQCEACAYYNNGEYSQKCPSDNLEKIRANQMKCPNKSIKHKWDLTKPQ
ncbi:hypothetical protein [Butyrivibrio sp. FCS014]|uniref:hypothetical protein n=1 Tax=Butyrivibrio sp. FCS014 TaxID=1408304 RepID=UPI000464E62A|nr:hypothetical protein [Butyrivibrio sp. FCS014]